jgi:nucleotide-binding universal stress UspA family protein
MATANLSSVVVAVDGSEESMKALTWALDSLRLRPDGALVVLHVQSPPGIASGLNPRPIPFGGPSKQAAPQFRLVRLSSSCPFCLTAFSVGPRR